jgi:Xaa-Pro dipeptidase
MKKNQPNSVAYALRLEKLREMSTEGGLEGIVLVPGPNLRYFTSVNSLLLERPFLLFVPREGQPQLVAPTLESGPFLKAPVSMAVHTWSDGEGPRSAIEECAQRLDLQGKWGLEGRTPYGYIHALQRSANPQLEDAEPILQGIRELKNAQEVKLLQRAASILSKSFLKIPGMLKPGKSELEIAREISEEIQRNGAESAEDVLVQSGPMAADGHHLPGRRKIRRKESVVVDASCTYSGYFADIARTFIIGRDSTFETLYENVHDAQMKAIDTVKPGVTVGSIDGAARGLLQEKGLGEYFVHRTGHGLGLEVHEAPYIVPGGDEIVEPSMVFTVEPGVYMQGKTGLRIEDDILVTEKGRTVLTSSLPKDFEWWR